MEISTFIRANCLIGVFKIKAKLRAYGVLKVANQQDMQKKIKKNVLLLGKRTTLILIILMLLL